MTMTEEQKRMIDKVIKLLTLAESTDHPEEAETARRTAIEMMAKYNLSLGDRKDVQDFNIKEQSLDYWDDHQHYFYLMNAIGRFLDVCVIIIDIGNGRHILRYVGTESALSTFEYMKDIVERQRNFAWVKHSLDPRFEHETSSLVHRNKYYLGYAYGVGSKVSELLKQRNHKIQEWGLVPVSHFEKAKKWYAENSGLKLSHRSTVPSPHFRSGYDAGREVSLNRAVNHNGGMGTSKALK